MKHAASDEARERDKTRKKLKRAIAREEKKLQKAGFSSEEIDRNKNIQNMKNLLANSYYDKKKQTYIKSNDAIADTVDSFTYYQQAKNLKRESGESLGDYYQRKNKMFERNLNQATLKGGISTLNKEDVHLFYKVTQNAWNKAEGSEMRNVSILKTSRNFSLESVYNTLMNPEKSGKIFVESMLKRFGLNTTYEDYVAALKEARQIASAQYEAKISDTGSVKESAEAVRYSNYISFWASYLDSVKG